MLVIDFAVRHTDRDLDLVCGRGGQDIECTDRLLYFIDTRNLAVEHGPILPFHAAHLVPLAGFRTQYP
jgi:hypothetical protein